MARLTIEEFHKRPNLLVPHILMASFLYYCCPREPVLYSDSQFDGMMKLLGEKWGEVTHVHKHLITEGNIAAGSLFNLRWEDYPGIVKHAAVSAIGRDPYGL